MIISFDNKKVEHRAIAGRELGDELVHIVRFERHHRRKIGFGLMMILQAFRQVEVVTFPEPHQRFVHHHFPEPALQASVAAVLERIDVVQDLNKSHHYEIFGVDLIFKVAVPQTVQPIRIPVEKRFLRCSIALLAKFNQ